MLPSVGLGRTKYPVKQRAVKLARVDLSSSSDDEALTDVDSSCNFAQDDEALANSVTQDLDNGADFLLSKPLNLYLSLFSSPRLEQRPWLSDVVHATLLLRIFASDLSRFFLTTVLVAMIAVADVWPAESLIAARDALVAKCMSMPDDFFLDCYQMHLALLFELALRRPGVRWTSESLQDFLPFTLRCLQVSAIAVFPVIGEFLSTIAKDADIFDAAFPLLSEMVSTFVGRIYELGNFMPFLGVLLPLLKLLAFPDHDLSSDLYGLFQELVVVWLACEGSETYLLSGLDLVEPLWSRRAIPLSACDGSIIVHVCALTEDGPSFRVRHAASVIVLERMRDSMMDMAQGIPPADLLCLCFELFARMPFEATGVERLIAIQGFRAASEWCLTNVIQPPLVAILDGEQVGLSFSEWQETADEDVNADLQQLIKTYAEVFPSIFEPGTLSEQWT
jgi:hypothetical protein